MKTFTFVIIAALSLTPCGAAQENAATQPSATAQGGDSQPGATPLVSWQYGAFVDSAYLLDFNHPANDLFRSRGTSYVVDEPLIDMAGAYVRKLASESSRWGMEATVQAGQDTRIFGFSATAPNLPGYRGLRHLGPTDISYLLPIGKGLTIQGGIFNSLIGIDSLYAKDNYSYTRPWGADFTPYLMLGVNASYPVNKKLTVIGFVVNDYFHLADPNGVPSWGGQAAYSPNDRWSLKQTFLVGPHQSNTGFAYWRELSDGIAQWKRDPFGVGFEFQAATEKVDVPGTPRAAWIASQMPAHWAINKEWGVTVRPEVAWDSEGRWTGFAQTVKALTTTLEYRHTISKATAIVRLEHRIDVSTGPGGGFFRGHEIAPRVVPLVPTQHLLTFAVILTYDGQHR